MVDGDASGLHVQVDALKHTDFGGFTPSKENPRFLDCSQHPEVVLSSYLRPSTETWYWNLSA